jgi:hypothetical protein
MCLALGKGSWVRGVKGRPCQPKLKILFRAVDSRKPLSHSKGGKEDPKKKER